MPKKTKRPPVQAMEVTGGVDLSLLHRIVPCRGKQIEDIYALMGEPWQHTVPSIYVYGHSSCGKSLVLENLMTCLECPYVNVNCVESYLVTIIFQEILRGILDSCSKLSHAECNLPKKCDNMSDFVRHLKVLMDVLCVEETVYIILSKADRLREKDPCLLAGLLNLQELTSQNICVILEAQVTWDKFYGSVSGKAPCVMHFPSYTKDELKTILCFLRPSEASNDLYEQYIGILLSVFFVACRDLRELQHLARLNFPIYYAPVKNGIAAESNHHKLWKNIEPHLRDALRTVHLGEVSSDEWTRLHYKHCDVDEETGVIAPFVGKERRSALGNVELPLYSKFLLIAAYLASYNPVKTDLRFFVKLSKSDRLESSLWILDSLCAVLDIRSRDLTYLTLSRRILPKSAGKHKKTLKSIKKNERLSAHLKGPKAFPLDRLMAIFYSIVDDRVPPSVSLFSQISTLVSLQLLARVGHDDQIDSPKYKCTATLDFIQAISRTVEFEVMRYLFDFI